MTTADRDAALLALEVARARVDDLTVNLARHAGIDTQARRMVQVLACFGPVLSAIEYLIPPLPPPTDQH
jgi:hypothetical protein